MNQKQWLILISVLGTVVGMGTLTFVFADGFSYFKSSPEACNNCHVMNETYHSWQRNRHGQHATCQDCHLPHESPEKWIEKARQGFNHSYAFTLTEVAASLSISEKGRKVVQANCLRCHGKLFSEYSIVHRSEDGLACSSCHQDVGHLH